ncbi:MAG TPA: alanine racemase [Stellaceae bacterium]|nr:alanine racemase [Stellaceae bacterium]
MALIEDIATAEAQPLMPPAPEIHQAVAERFGTPTHLLDLARLDANFRRVEAELRRALPEMRVLYSVKTNYMPLVLTRLRMLGCGADVVSGIELDLALRTGFAPDGIVFNGPHKTDDELAAAVAHGVFVNVDNLDEAARLDRIAAAAGRRVAFGLRVNPGRAIYTSADPTYNAQALAASRESKFGLSLEDGAAAGAARALSRLLHLQLVGLHCHLGSHMNEPAALSHALEAVFQFAAGLRADHPVDRVNIGGGFGVDGIWRERKGPLRHMLALYGKDPLGEPRGGLDLAALGRLLSPVIARHGLAGIKLFCEPGRAIVSDAMTLIARVSCVKRTGGVDWVILDAGLNIMPTLGMQERHRIIALPRTAGRLKAFRIGGPLCYEGDILAHEAALPETIAEGDLVLIEDSGGYTISRSTNFIRPRAAVAAFADGKLELCWRRETYEDVLAYHCPTSFDLRPAAPDATA